MKKPVVAHDGKRNTCSHLDREPEQVKTRQSSFLGGEGLPGRYSRTT
jgi:hypothetical protein